MSGYFGALLRSTGLTAGSVQPVVSAQVDGLELERVVTAAPLPTQTAPALAVAPAPLPTAVQPKAAAPLRRSALPVAPDISVRSETTPKEEPAMQDTLPATPQPAVQAAHAGEQRAAAAQVPEPESTPAAQPFHTLVQAAMQWVAADPAVAVDAGPVMVQQPRAADEPARTSRTSPPVEVTAQIRPVRELMQAMARPVPPAPITGDAPSANGEVLDISIGTIQVHVDGPAAQTVALPQPPAAPAPKPERNGLARRSLRRI